MKFFEFAKILKPIIAGNSNAADFVIELFKAITEFTDNIDADSYLGIMPSTARHYYSGDRNISRLAIKIRKFIEPEKFGDYINKLSDEIQLQILTEFSKYCPEMTKMNVAEKLAELFKSIIIEASNKERVDSNKGDIEEETTKLLYDRSISDCDLNKEAQIILAYAIQTPDNETVIVKIRTKTEYFLSVNDLDLTEDNSTPKYIAKIEKAIEQLEENGYIEDLNYKGELFRITSDGFELGDRIIEELKINTNLPIGCYLK